MPPTNLSVQLYTVREALDEDLVGTLKRLADIGFTQVEPFGILSFPGLAAGLSETGLAAPTAHANFLGTDVEETFTRAVELGVTTVIDPFAARDRWGDAESVGRIAEELNAAAAAAREHGLTVGYHNHDHEITSTIDGRTALEVLADQLDPAVVLEVDTYWVAAGGGDPVALLSTLGGRVKALHIKDGPGTREPADQVAVGAGDMPVRDIIEAAPAALRVIELDDSRGDRFQAVADSFDYLVREGLA